ncbi:hypothetical protein HPB50_009348 [Hyalomma asiaticum]|uniref:Uncharacterized protein n=1 Tax=Hyalomma asiaticum TaxID=266040 RepID=A0ACB7T197_HYAAI|nr:hypothetical protein HPB50_009348 [Hyalomma asiaticum]
MAASLGTRVPVRTQENEEELSRFCADTANRTAVSARNFLMSRVFYWSPYVAAFVRTPPRNEAGPWPCEDSSSMRGERFPGFRRGPWSPRSWRPGASRTSAGACNLAVPVDLSSGGGPARWFRASPIFSQDGDEIIRGGGRRRGGGIECVSGSSSDNEAGHITAMDKDDAVRPCQQQPPFLRGDWRRRSGRIFPDVGDWQGYFYNLSPVVLPNKERPLHRYVFGKTLERLLNSRLQHFLRRNRCIYERQFGFTSAVRALHNLETRLLHLKASKIPAVLMAVDFQGAFDSVWYPEVFRFFRSLSFFKHADYLKEKMESLTTKVAHSSTTSAHAGSTAVPCPEDHIVEKCHIAGKWVRLAGLVERTSPGLQTQVRCHFTATQDVYAALRGCRSRTTMFATNG